MWRLEKKVGPEEQKDSRVISTWARGAGAVCRNLEGPGPLHLPLPCPPQISFLVINTSKW